MVDVDITIKINQMDGIQKSAWPIQDPNSYWWYDHQRFSVAIPMNQLKYEKLSDPIGTIVHPSHLI